MEEKKFEHGEIVATNAIQKRMVESEEFSCFVRDSLIKHLSCDWGDICKEDKELNDIALKTGKDRLFSAYIRSFTKEKIWIITEHDGSRTTILFPSDY